MPANESTETSLRAENAELRAQLEEGKRNAALSSRLIEQAPVGMYVVDAQFRVAQMNEGALPFFASVQPLIGRDFDEVLKIVWGPEIGPQCASIFRHTLATGDRYVSPRFFEQRHDSGKQQAFEWETQRITLPDGQLGVVCYFQDVTAREHAEAALRLTNQRFDLAVKCSQVVLWQQDAELRFTWLHNPAPGIDGSNAVGKRDADLLERAEDAAVIEGLKREVIRSGVGMRREFFPHIRGVRHCFEVLMEPVRDPAGRITGLTGAAIDITERKEAEKARHEAERQYQALAEASSEVPYRMSADWSTMLPLDGRQLVASSDQPLAGWAWMDQNLPRDEHPRVRQAIGDAIARKALFELEHRVRRPDGSDGWTLSRAVPILDENEDLTAWFGAASDITGRKEAEKALADRTELLNGVLEGTSDVILVRDLKGRCLMANAACATVLGSATGQVVGKTAEDLYPPDLAVAVRQHDEAVIVGGSPVQCEETFLVAGEERVFLTLKAPLRDGSGHVIGILGISRDITDRKHAEVALRDNAALLASFDRRKDAFLATLSHELRNPLAVISNSLQILKVMQSTGQDHGADEQVFARMQRQVDLMKRLIDDLMDISRINQDKLTLQTEVLDLATVVQSALENSRTVLDQRGHAVTVELPRWAIKVDGDATRLAQVVGNLLSNAAKYSDPGSPIGLTVELQDDMAAVRVRDHGIGIGTADLHRVFEMFAQVSGEANLTQGGLGIGLNLVKRLVEMHGGSVEARSEGVGHGSEFLVRLPLALTGPVRSESRGRVTNGKAASLPRTSAA